MSNKEFEAEPTLTLCPGILGPPVQFQCDALSEQLLPCIQAGNMFQERPIKWSQGMQYGFVIYWILFVSLSLNLTESGEYYDINARGFIQMTNACVYGNIFCLDTIC